MTYTRGVHNDECDAEDVEVVGVAEELEGPAAQQRGGGHEGEADVGERPAADDDAGGQGGEGAVMCFEKWR